MCEAKEEEQMSTSKPQDVIMHKPEYRKDPRGSFADDQYTVSWTIDTEGESYGSVSSELLWCHWLDVYSDFYKIECSTPRSKRLIQKITLKLPTNSSVCDYFKTQRQRAVQFLQYFHAKISQITDY
jgi:hypothetical protein